MSPDPTDLVAIDRERRADAAKAEKREHGQAEDLKWLMADKRGRRIVWRLLQSTGAGAISYTGNSETFYREGRRSVGLDLQGRIEALSFEDFIRMQQENRSNE